MKSTGGIVGEGGGRKEETGGREAMVNAGLGVRRVEGGTAGWGWPVALWYGKGGRTT